MGLSIYAAKMHTIILCSIPVEGWADGDVLELEPAGPDYTWKQGTDGQVVRSDPSQSVWKGTLHLMQNSDTNGLFRALAAAGKLAANGADVSASLVRNQLGTFSFSSPQTFIETPAGYKIGAEVSPSDWTFIFIDPIILGN